VSNFVDACLVTYLAFHFYILENYSLIISILVGDANFDFYMIDEFSFLLLT
jgi:hypothetical protein